MVPAKSAFGYATFETNVLLYRAFHSLFFRCISILLSATCHCCICCSVATFPLHAFVASSSELNNEGTLVESATDKLEGKLGLFFVLYKKYFCQDISLLIRYVGLPVYGFLFYGSITNHKIKNFCAIATVILKLFLPKLQPILKIMPAYQAHASLSRSKLLCCHNSSQFPCKEQMGNSSQGTAQLAKEGTMLIPAMPLLWVMCLCPKITQIFRRMVRWMKLPVSQRNSNDSA